MPNSRTFELPTGERVRTATKSPYVLILAYDGGPFVHKRSASVDTLRKERGKRPSAKAWIGTVATGEVRAV